MPPEFYGSVLFRRSKEPVKVITADGTRKNKTCQGEGHGYIKQEACLVNHQDGADSYKKAAENKEIEDHFQ